MSEDRLCSSICLCITHTKYPVQLGATSLLNYSDGIRFSSGFPGDPATFHELKIKSTTSSTPVPSLVLVKIVGSLPLVSFASRSMTSRDMDTNGAISIYMIVKLRLSRQVATHFIDYKEIGVGDTKSSPPRDLVSTLGIDGVDMGPLITQIVGITATSIT